MCVCTCGHSQSEWAVFGPVNVLTGSHTFPPSPLALPAQDPVWLQEESVEEDPGVLTTCVQVSKKSLLFFLAFPPCPLPMAWSFSTPQGGSPGIQTLGL